MKNSIRIISLVLALMILTSVFSIISTSAVTYTDSKGSATLTCGSFKKTYTAYSYGSFTRAVSYALKDAGANGTSKKPATVKIAKGYYKLQYNLVVYSNTILDATGSFFKFNDCMVRNGFNGDKTSASGYTGSSNITVKGGTWDIGVSYSNATNTGSAHSTFRFAHCKNITIDGVTFLNNYNCHDIEMGGVYNAEIKNCTFKNSKNVNSLELINGTEAIQFDLNTSTAFPGYPSYDSTPSKKIKIHDNVFKNKFRGIGSHHGSVGNAFNNIQIYKNKMTDIAGVAIYCVHTNNAKIYNNTLKNVGSGIYLNSVYNSGNMINTYNKSYADTVKTIENSKSYIYGNKITVRNANNKLTSSYGVRAEGSNYTATNSTTKIKKGTYYIYNVNIGLTPKGKISKNKISGNVDAGVSLRYTQGCKVYGNNIDINKSTKSRVYGVEVRCSKKTDIQSNTITNSKRQYAFGVNVEDLNGSGIVSNKVNIQNNNITTYAKSNLYNYGIRSCTDTNNVTIKNNTINSGNECVLGLGDWDKLKTKKNYTITNNTLDTISASYHISLKRINLKSKIADNFTYSGETCSVYTN